jgi:hypothetical protein
MARQEQRRFPRVPEALAVRYRASGALAGSWCSVTAVNLSAGGIRFRCAEPLDVGASLQLELKLPGAAEAMVLRGQVAWSQMMASGVMESGVAFLDVAIPQQRLLDQLVSFLNRRV